MTAPPSAGGDAASRLAAQIEFLLEADQLKQVERRTTIIGGSRRENSAEHSWHLALFALVLAEHADEPVDVARVVTMLLLHDLVEVDAGDTFVYDVESMATKDERERAAADRLYGLLPGEQGRGLRALWEEFEARETSDARFAAAIDRLQPMLLNHANGGGGWREHGIDVTRVREANRGIEAGSAVLWALALGRLDDAVDRGLFDGVG